MFDGQGDATLAIKPFAVPIPEAQRLLGDKGRSPLYEAISRGELRAVKDGNKTLIVLESIERYMAALPPAKFDSERFRSLQSLSQKGTKETRPGKSLSRKSTKERRRGKRAAGQAAA
jgi:hypothetical protein